MICCTSWGFLRGAHTDPVLRIAWENAGGHKAGGQGEKRCSPASAHPCAVAERCEDVRVHLWAWTTSQPPGWQLSQTISPPDTPDTLNTCVSNLWNCLKLSPLWHVSVWVGEEGGVPDEVKVIMMLVRRMIAIVTHLLPMGATWSGQRGWGQGGFLQAPRIQTAPSPEQRRYILISSYQVKNFKLQFMLRPPSNNTLIPFAHIFILSYHHDLRTAPVHNSATLQSHLAKA